MKSNMTLWEICPALFTIKDLGTNTLKLSHKTLFVPNVKVPKQSNNVQNLNFLKIRSVLGLVCQLLS